MEKTKSIAIIAFSVFFMVMLLAYGNIEKAFALTVRTNESDTTSGAMSGVGYNSVQDKIVTTEITGGVAHIHIIEGDTLTQLADLTTTLTGSADLGTDAYPCSATICFVWGAVGANPTVIRVNMVTDTISVTYSEAEYAGCVITNLEFFGSAIYATMADLGGCPYTGMYQLSSGFTSDVASDIQWIEYDSLTSIGGTSEITGSCLVEGRYFVTARTSSAEDVRIYDLSTKSVTDSANMVDAPSNIHCDTDFETGYIYVTSILGDWVKRVKLSSLLVDATSFSLVDANHIMQRGDSLYVGRNNAVTITAITKDLTSGFTFYSGQDNNFNFFKGNSTRFNGLTTGGTDDNIFYAFDGVIDESEQEEEGTGLEGSANGVCLNVDANGDGVINVLDCVGSVTAFEGFTSGQNATDITASITDGLGLTNCGTTNPDHETCGSGLFMFVFLLLLLEFLSLAGYLGFTGITGAERNLMDISIIMLVLAFAALAIGFYLNWIPDIVFYSIVVLIAGLMAFGILRHIRGG